MNRLFPSLLQPLFQGESTSEVFVMKLVFIHVEVITKYHNKNLALLDSL